MKTRLITARCRRLLPALLAGSLLAACGGDDLSAWDPQRSCFALSSQVEQWRELVEKHFKPEHVTWALHIIDCESGGDPNAVNSSSGASGLFQHMPQYWDQRAANAGFAGASPFDPEANIAASAWLLYAPGGGPSHWSCKYSPFEDFSYEPQFYENGEPVGGGGGTTTPPTTSCDPLPAEGGTIDDGDSACFQLYGPSEYWRSVNGKGIGGGLRWTDAIQAGSPDNSAKWQVNLLQAGKYEVSFYAVAEYAIFSATRYVVRHGGKETEVTADQSGGDGWHSLGTFEFAAGADQHVMVYDNTDQAVGSGQHIVADAIKLEPAAGGEAPPESPLQPPQTQEPEPGTDVTTDPGYQEQPYGASDRFVIGGCAVSPSSGGRGSSAGVLALLALIAIGRHRRSR